MQSTLWVSARNVAFDAVLLLLAESQIRGATVMVDLGRALAAPQNGPEVVAVKRPRSLKISLASAPSEPYREPCHRFVGGSVG